MKELFLAFDEQQKREDLRAGTIAAALYNLANLAGQSKYPRKANDSPYMPGDFFPSLRIDEPPISPADIEFDEKIAFLRLFKAPEEKIQRLIEAHNAGHPVH